jgi:hypothetical protein
MKHSSRSSHKFASVVAVVLGLILSVATPAEAISWLRFKSTSTPLATYFNSAGGYTTSIYNTNMLLCSGGTWTKQVGIWTTAGPTPYTYQGTACTGAGPASFAIANAQARCRSVTASPPYNYAECWYLK